MLTAKTIDKEAKDSFVKLFKTEILLLLFVAYIDESKKVIL